MYPAKRVKIFGTPEITAHLIPVLSSTRVLKVTSNPYGNILNDEYSLKIDENIAWQPSCIRTNMKYAITNIKKLRTYFFIIITF